MTTYLRLVALFLVGLVLMGASGILLLFCFGHGLQEAGPADTSILFGIYASVLAVSIFCIPRLVNGLFRMSQYVPAEALAWPPEPLAGLQDQFRALRIAIALKTGVSLILLLGEFVPLRGFGYFGPSIYSTVTLLLTFVGYQMPYVIVFFALRRRPGRIPVAICLALPWMVMTLSLYSLTTFLDLYHLRWQSPFMVSITCLRVAVALGLELAIFMLALPLKRYFRLTLEQPVFAITAVLSLVYTVAFYLVIVLAGRVLYASMYHGDLYLP